MTSIHPGSSNTERSLFSGGVAVGVKRGLGCADVPDGRDCFDPGWTAMMDSRIGDDPIQAGVQIALRTESRLNMA